MIKLVSIRRVTVITDVLLKQRVLEGCCKLGARGYTSMDCHGQGRHAVMEDPYTGNTLVRLEFLVQPEVAMKILDFMHGETFVKFAATVCSEPVEVAESDAF